ncbi:MAG: hypothetical protein ABI169_13025 [Chitinophagaceae bacterium]
METNFCNFSKEQEDALRGILGSIFSVNDESFQKIVDCYKVFKSDFKGPVKPGWQTIERKSLLPISENQVLINDFQSGEIQLGIDLPVLIDSENGSNKTVFIVAEDPLRGDKDRNIMISTPFGLHMEKERIGKQKICWKVVEHFLEKGYQVYVTDINKLWMKKDGEYKMPLDRLLFENFKSAFENEMEIFNPEFIVTFGKKAELAVTPFIKAQKILHFLHPSGSANKSWVKLNIGVCNDVNKIIYMKDQIDGALLK